MRILIVEDDRNGGEGLRTLLEMDGHDVDLFETVTEARRRIATAVYDVALIDVHLPDGDGTGLVPELKACDTVVYLATGSTTLTSDGDTTAFADPAQQAKDCGADGYISKPINYERLLHKLG